MTKHGGIQSEIEMQSDRLRQTEHRRLRALVGADMEVARQLHAVDFQLITPIGGALSKEQYLGAIASGQIKYLLWEPGPIEVQLRGQVSFIRYQAELEVIFGGHHVAVSQYWHTDIYEQRAEGWQVVWSQATAIK